MDNVWVEHIISNTAAYASFLLEMAEHKKRYTEGMKNAVREGNHTASELALGSELAVDDLTQRVVGYQREKIAQAEHKATLGK